MDNIHQKITQTSRILARVMRVASIITVISGVLVVAFSGVLMFPESGWAVSLLGSLRLPLSNEPVVVTAGGLLRLFPFALILLIGSFFLIRELECLFTDMSRNHSPFEQKQVTRVKKVAWFTLGLTLLSAVFDAVAANVLYGRSTFQLDVVQLAFVGVIYCIAYIFDYGCRLQRLSDETL